MLAPVSLRLLLMAKDTLNLLLKSSCRYFAKK